MGTVQGQRAGSADPASLDRCLRDDSTGETFLTVLGTASLTVTLILAILEAFGVVDETAPTAILAGMTLATFVGVFVTRPSSDLQRNLTNLAVFKMILESHA